MKLHTQPQSDGRGGAEYPAFAWPGGYPLYYSTADDGILCPGCANGKNGSEAGSRHKDPRWRLVACEAWEGEPLQCDHCGAQI